MLRVKQVSSSVLRRPRVAPAVAAARSAGPGLALASGAALLAWVVHVVFPALPLLTVAVALGILFANLPGFSRPDSAPHSVLAAGLQVASRTCMRLGIVLLGLELSLVDVAGLGWVTVLGVIAVLVCTFALTYLFGRAMRLPGQQPLLVAAGFSICGASAIGAMSRVTRSDEKEAATPIALVTLCGTLAIVVLPVLWHPLGLTDLQFGHWVGASVHDVGQVVATAQIAGSGALALAVVVKLTRVLMLAPMVGVGAWLVRRQERQRQHAPGAAEASAPTDGASGDTIAIGPATTASSARPALPPILPWFVAGFLLAVLLRTLVPLPEAFLTAADLLRTVLLAVALFGLGAAVRLGELVRTGWRALLVALVSWAFIAALALAAVHLG